MKVIRNVWRRQLLGLVAACSLFTAAGAVHNTLQAAKVPICAPHWTGNLCQETELCAGYGGNKVCNTTYTYYQP